MSESAEQNNTQESETFAPDVNFSPSVLRAEKNIESSSKDGFNISSWDWVREFLSIHANDYVPKNYQAFKSLAINPEAESFDIKSIEEWKSQVISVIDQDIIQKQQPFEVHGKLFILCLCELDKTLKSYLSQGDLLSEIKQNTTPPFENLLPGTPDQRVILDDSPVYEDALGRNSFARAMCIWLDNNWSMRPKQINSFKDTKSFILHVGGPWGSGKSTLLNLIDKGFKCKKPKLASKLNEEILDVSGDWITVWFNAWRNQHFEPAWWPLMNKIFKDATLMLAQRYNKPFKCLWIFLREKLWRFFIGKIWYFIAFLVSIGILIFLYNWMAKTPDDSDPESFLKRYEEIIKAVGSILGLFGTIWTGILIFSKSLISGSSDSAKSFVQQVKDPLEKVKKHFRNYINTFEKNNHPVLVYIDDLDRCNPEYVVDLLESIQTIFTHRNLYFIVAADRRWLYNSFEERYKTFKYKITELGKSLGYLFLEKAIQASVTVPRMDPIINKKFMDNLYNIQIDDLRQKINDKKNQYQEQINNIKDDKKLSEFLKENKGDEITKQALRELAIEKSATKVISESTEYFLREFTHLLEPNPRAIKRFVNAYNIYKTLAYTIDDSLIDTIDKKRQFALWTIISIRWPVLAEMLEQEPEKVEELKRDVVNIKNNKWKPFINNHLIKSVISGEGTDAKLTEKAIIGLCRINPIVHSSRRRE